MYLHPSADRRRTEDLITASLDRLGVCNRLNLLLIDQAIWEQTTPWIVATRLSDCLAVACVGAGCTGIPSIVLIDFAHPTSIGITTIGAIAVAAFGASGFHGRRG